MEIPAAGARTRGARHRRTWAARYIRVSLGPGAGTTNRSAPVGKGGAGRVHGGARGVTLPFPRLVALVVITTSPLMRFGCRHAAAEMSCRADEWPRLMRTCAPRTNSKILHSGQFSKWNACHVRDTSRSLIEMHGRDRTSEELSLPFQASAARCIRALITEPQQDYHSTGHYGVNSDEIGESCRGIRFFHDNIAHQSQMGPDPVAMDTRHAFFRYGRENPDSQGIFRSGATYGYNDCYLKDPGRNQCNRFPVENFVSQEQIIYEDAALHNASDLSSFQRWASNKSQSTPAITTSPVQKQSSMSNQDPRLAASSSATPPSVFVPPNQQAAVIIQPETSVLSGRTVYKLEFEIDSSGKPVILSHSVSLSAGNLTVNPSENNNGEPKGTAQAKENDIKKSKAQNMFKTALTDFVKEGLEEIWRRGCLTKELFKIIARKVVEKVMSSEKMIPETKQKIESYLTSNKKRIDRLIQDYLGKYNVKRLPSI